MLSQVFDTINLMTQKGKIQKKILLMLLAGLSLSMSKSPKRHFRIIREARKEWEQIDKRALEVAIESLYKSRLVDQKTNRDGTVTFILSNDGKKEALTYDIDNIKIIPRPWDRKWRIVIYDIPDKLKKIREIFRDHLKRLGFIELQHSVFTLPYNCKKEIDYIIEFYNIRRFVRYIEATHLDNELDLKNKFHIT